MLKRAAQTGDERPLLKQAEPRWAAGGAPVLAADFHRKAGFDIASQGNSCKIRGAMAIPGLMHRRLLALDSCRGIMDANLFSCVSCRFRSSPSHFHLTLHIKGDRSAPVRATTCLHGWGEN